MAVYVLEIQQSLNMPVGRYVCMYVLYVCIVHVHRYESGTASDVLCTPYRLTDLFAPKVSFLELAVEKTHFRCKLNRRSVHQVMTERN